MPPPPPPPPPPFQQQFTNLLNQVVPLMEEAYAFSQVVGHILVATNQTSGPPPTYYIGEDLNNPTSPQQPPPPPTNAPVPIASFGDQAGGLQLTGTGYEVFIGLGGNPIATVSGSYAGGAPVLKGSSNIGAGGTNFPVAAQGSPTAVGPITDVVDDGVYMGTDVSQGTVTKHKLYTVGGSGSAPDQQDPGCYPQVCANDGDVKKHYDWMPVIYPATPFPEGPSVKQGIQNLISQISGNHGTFAIFGYSQGAVVSCKVWRDEILNPNGQLHDRIDDFIAHVTFGNPMRCPGIANGNALAGLPIPAPVDGWVTGGIAGPDDLTPWQTMPQHMDFAHEGDLYADCPTGMDPWSNESEVGAMETSIYKMVMLEIAGQDSILLEVGKILTDPISELVPLFEAMINGIQFLAAGTSPHSDYNNCQQPAIDYLANRGAQVPARDI